MRIARKTKGMPGDTNLISMINIVFLILVFFMLIGRLTPKDALLIDPPISMNAKPSEPVDIVVLVDSAGRVAVNSERVDPAALPTALSKRLEQNGMSAVTSVVLKADADARFEQLDEVLDQIRKLGVTRISLATDTSR